MTRNIIEYLQTTTKWINILVQSQCVCCPNVLPNANLFDNLLQHIWNDQKEGSKWVHAKIKTQGNSIPLNFSAEANLTNWFLS